MFEEKFKQIKVNKEFHHLKIERQHLAESAIELLEKATPEDWEKPIKVTFEGEEGIDEGGLTREFFTLLFESPYFFDGKGSFVVNTLDKQHFCLLGKMTAVALIHGHPGPNAFSKQLTKDILRVDAIDLEQSDNKTQSSLKMVTALKSFH